MSSAALVLEHQELADVVHAAVHIRTVSLLLLKRHFLFYQIIVNMVRLEWGCWRMRTHARRILSCSDHNCAMEKRAECLVVLRDAILGVRNSLLPLLNKLGALPLANLSANHLVHTIDDLAESCAIAADAETAALCRELADAL